MLQQMTKLVHAHGRRVKQVLGGTDMTDKVFETFTAATLGKNCSQLCKFFFQSANAVCFFKTSCKCVLFDFSLRLFDEAQALQCCALLTLQMHLSLHDTTETSNALNMCEFARTRKNSTRNTIGSKMSKKTHFSQIFAKAHLLKNFKTTSKHVMFLSCADHFCASSLANNELKNNYH